jgi:putative PIG3 family NAD(P)H quinone oxidoreductase
MRAVIAPVPGGPEVLQIVERPAPGDPGPGEVLVQVAATAVNRADLMQRMGFYDPPAGESDILGLECSGTVAAVGPGVSRWAPGDQVCALLAAGGYAEQVIVSEGQLMPVPAGVSVLEAAALPEVACTVWANVFDLARLQPEETLLVHGGASGIGTHAIQVATARGSRVVVTCSAHKREVCLSYGAAVAVDYRAEDFAEVLDPVDVILDNMGAKYLQRNVSLLATNGRLIVIGLQGGVSGELPLGILLPKRGSVHATSLRMRTPAEKARVCAGVVAETWPLVQSGRVRPVIDRILPLEQVAQAHRIVGASEHVGKVLLSM